MIDCVVVALNFLSLTAQDMDSSSETARGLVNGYGARYAAFGGHRLGMDFYLEPTVKPRCGRWGLHWSM